MKNNQYDQEMIQCEVCEDTFPQHRVGYFDFANALCCIDCAEEMENDMELELRHKCAMDAEISGELWQP